MFQLPWLQIQYEASGFRHPESSFSNLRLARPMNTPHQLSKVMSLLSVKDFIYNLWRHESSPIHSLFKMCLEYGVCSVILTEPHTHENTGVRSDQEKNPQYTTTHSAGPFILFCEFHWYIRFRIWTCWRDRRILHTVLRISLIRFRIWITCWRDRSAALAIRKSMCLGNARRPWPKRTGGAWNWTRWSPRPRWESIEPADWSPECWRSAAPWAGRWGATCSAADSTRWSLALSRRGTACCNNHSNTHTHTFKLYKFVHTLGFLGGCSTVYYVWEPRAFMTPLKNPLASIREVICLDIFVYMCIPF